MLGNCEEARADIAVEIAHDSNAGSTAFNSGLDRVCGRYIFETDASVVLCPLVAIGGDMQNDSFEFGIADSWRRFEAQLNVNRTDGVMNGGFTVRRMIGDGPFKLGIGGTYWIKDSPGSGSQFTFQLGMRYRF